MSRAVGRRWFRSSGEITPPAAQRLVDLVGQLVDEGGVCLLGDLLLGFLGDELVVAGTAGDSIMDYLRGREDLSQVRGQAQCSHF